MVSPSNQAACDECPWRERGVDIDRLNIIIRGLIKRLWTHDGEIWVRHPYQDAYYCSVTIDHEAIVGLSRSELVKTLYERLREGVADCLINSIEREAQAWLPRPLP
jgi:hypothetical protein